MRPHQLNYARELKKNPESTTGHEVFIFLSRLNKHAKVMNNLACNEGFDVIVLLLEHFVVINFLIVAISEIMVKKS